MALPWREQSGVMMKRVSPCVALVIFGFSVLSVNADPCGLVPPAQWVKTEAPIQRVGIQKTYVFFKDGLQTIVLRPEFQGKIDEFGMLIPFPTAPAIRKLPGKVFEHIAAAIDPPEVVLGSNPTAPQFPFNGMGGGGMGGGLGGGDGGLTFRTEQVVRVIRREAIGMYEVAVLEAGSTTALKRWMKTHSFRFPTGMEPVCSEYIRQKWCFVVVKAKVKHKAASQPRPGQRQINNQLPAAATFDGHVQAMGFRFRVKRPVIPMRLSVFNSAKLRNVVYFLTERSAMIEQLGPGYVVRQVPGATLYRNLTRPLPLRVIGRIGKLTSRRRRQLKAERDPAPHNRIAAELFASDLGAARSGKLMRQRESLEKQLVEIGEELSLRSPAYDRTVKYTLRKQGSVRPAALRGLASMTMTVVDGDFPRETLAQQNLTFGRYRMDPLRSTPQFYDAKKFGPTPRKPGKLYLGAAIPKDRPQIEFVASKVQQQSNHWPAGLCLVCGCCGIVFVRRVHKRQSAAWLLVVLILALPLNQTTAGPPAVPLRGLYRQLDDPQKASSAITKIVNHRSKSAAVRGLIQHGRSHRLTRKGWAMVGLARLGGPAAVRYLRSTSRNRRQPRIVRVWAAAALLQCASNDKYIREVIEMARSRPELVRPLAIHLPARYARAPGDDVQVEGLVELSQKFPELTKIALTVGPEPLLRAAFRSKLRRVRRGAAGLVAALGNQPQRYDHVAAALIKIIKFDPRAKKVPWSGGPLLLPRLRWSQLDAELVVRHLVTWRVWAQRKRRFKDVARLEKTLSNAWSICSTAGFTLPKDHRPDKLLKALERVIGAAAIAEVRVQLKQADKPDKNTRNGAPKKDQPLGTRG